MGFETPPIIPPSEELKKNELGGARLPRNEWTEIGPVSPEMSEKIDDIMKSLTEKKIDSEINRFISPVMKERRDSILDKIVSLEERHGNDQDWKRYANSLGRDLEKVDVMIENYDKIRSKIILGRELSADEIKEYSSHIDNIRERLDLEIYSIKDKSSDEYKNNRNQYTRMFAFGLFLKRKSSKM